MAAIGILIYLAYFVLRGSLVDEQQKARISAVYNIFAFAALIPLLYILPRLVASLHPGSAENSTFNVQKDVNAAMRVVFYPAIIGWTLLGWWIITLRVRLRKVTQTMIDKEYEKEIAGS
jgi:heme exporter protein C